MEDINENVNELKEVSQEEFEDDFKETSGPSKFVGVLVGAGIGVLSTIAYNKLVKPAIHKVVDVFKKSDKPEETVIKDVEINETVIDD